MKFTTPVSMPVNEAQYNELKPLLEAMGYDVRNPITRDWTNINTNATDINSIVEFGSGKCKYGQLLLPTYNKDLFLALAAMTDEPNGIAGEWWKCLYTGYGCTNGRLYKCIKVAAGVTWVVSDNERKISVLKSYFTKATAAEIFAHFGVSYGKEQAEPIQPEITQPKPIIPQGCTFREWQRTFLAGCFAQGILSREDYFDNAILVQNVDLLISELDKTK